MPGTMRMASSTVSVTCVAGDARSYVFEHVALHGNGGPAVASEPQRALAVRRAIAGAGLSTLERSAATAGFADSLLTALDEVDLFVEAIKTLAARR